MVDYAAEDDVQAMLSAADHANHRKMELWQQGRLVKQWKAGEARAVRIGPNADAGDFPRKD